MSQSLDEQRKKLLKEAHKKSLSIRQAASFAGVNKDTAERYFNSWKEPEIYPTVAAGQISYQIPLDIKESLAEEAKRRKISLRRLVSDILSSVVDCNLYESVLDSSISSGV
jgi:transposase